MKNLHVLPTDHPSRLRYNIKTNFWELNEFHKYHTDIKSTHNIYITSSEVIKKGDYVVQINFEKTNTQVIKCETEFQTKIANSKDGSFSKNKIILTTDSNLIKDGVQEINDEFLEWFVKNSSCEFVELKHIIKEYVDDQDAYGYDVNYYKIIIPKEDTFKYEARVIPKEEFKQELDCPYDFTSRCTIDRCDCKPKQKTLEEAAKNYAIDNSLIGYELMPYKGFIAGAKWQQERSYSEDEVKTIINDIVEKHCAYFNQETKDVVKLEWFDKIKKK